MRVLREVILGDLYDVDPVVILEADGGVFEEDGSTGVVPGDDDE